MVFLRSSLTYDRTVRVIEMIDLSVYIVCYFL